MTDLNQHAFAIGQTKVSHGMLVCMKLLQLFLGHQLSQSTMCEGVAITHSEERILQH